MTCRKKLPQCQFWKIVSPRCCTDIPFGSAFSLVVGAIVFIVAMTGDDIETVQNEIRKVVMSSSWGSNFPRMAEIDLVQPAFWALLTICWLNFTVLVMSLFSTEWFYTKRVSKMTEKSMCRMPAVMWVVHWVVLFGALFVMGMAFWSFVGCSFSVIMSLLANGACHANISNRTAVANEILASGKQWICKLGGDEENYDEDMWLRDLCQKLPAEVTDEDIEIACDAHDVCLPLLAGFLFGAFVILYWQAIATLAQRGNLDVHNARNGFAKRAMEKRSVDVIRVNDTTDGGKILI